MPGRASKRGEEEERGEGKEEERGREGAKKKRMGEKEERGGRGEEREGGRGGEGRGESLSSANLSSEEGAEMPDLRSSSREMKAAEPTVSTGRVGGKGKARSQGVLLRFLEVYRSREGCREAAAAEEGGE